MLAAYAVAAVAVLVGGVVFCLPCEMKMILGRSRTKRDHQAPPSPSSCTDG